MRENFSLRKIVLCTAFIIITIKLTNLDLSSLIRENVDPPRSQVGELETTCSIKWDDRHIDSPKYEVTDRPVIPFDSKGRLPKPTRVKLLYPNPVMKLRPDYFVLAILQNGPNNQLVGFREVIFLAIKLNRTVVIPQFIKHHTDNRTLPFVSPVHRLQVSDLCSFVSCVSIEQFTKACGYVLHGMLNTRYLARNYWVNVLKNLGMKAVEANLPLIPDDGLKGRPIRHYKGSDIPNIFTSKARCVIFPKPLINLHASSSAKDREEFEKKKNFIQCQDDLDSASEHRLALTIALHTRSPKYITKLARDFAIQSMSDQPYISIHWRYQPNEFMVRCRHNPDSNFVKKRICENAMDITPVDIAVAIEKKIASIRSPAIKYIYFATPASEQAILSEVATYLYENHGYLTYSFLDLVTFLTEKFAPCRKLQDHFNDILSTTEMEICALSSAFLGSIRSSWSDVVHVARKTTVSTDTSNDGDVFTLSLSALRQRKGDTPQ